jgi:hypothetical protein
MRTSFTMTPEGPAGHPPARTARGGRARRSGAKSRLLHRYELWNAVLHPGFTHVFKNVKAPDGRENEVLGHLSAEHAQAMQAYPDTIYNSQHFSRHPMILRHILKADHS